MEHAIFPLQQWFSSHYYWHLGYINLCGRTALCNAGYLSTSLASTHKIPLTSPAAPVPTATIKDVSQHCPASTEGNNLYV